MNINLPFDRLISLPSFIRESKVVRTRFSYEEIVFRTFEYHFLIFFSPNKIILVEVGTIG